MSSNIYKCKKSSIFIPWYKDRDFSEVKSQGGDIVVFAPDSKQIERLIETHNTLLEYIEYLEWEIAKHKRNKG